MTFKLRQKPVVEPDKARQLELEIARIIATMTAPEALARVIELYGKEFAKANDEIQSLIAEVKRMHEANDELFKIKQKVVIANGELIHKNVELVKENDLLRATLEKAAKQQKHLYEER